MAEKINKGRFFRWVRNLAKIGGVKTVKKFVSGKLKEGKTGNRSCGFYDSVEINIKKEIGVCEENRTVSGYIPQVGDSEHCNEILKFLTPHDYSTDNISLNSSIKFILVYVLNLISYLDILLYTPRFL